MSLTVLFVFIGLGAFDFMMHKKELLKSEMIIYCILFASFIVIFILAYLGKIPPHFANIVKIW